MCFLWGTMWIFIYYINETQTINVYSQILSITSTRNTVAVSVTVGLQTAFHTWRVNRFICVPNSTSTTRTFHYLSSSDWKLQKSFSYFVILHPTKIIHTKLSSCKKLHHIYFLDPKLSGSNIAPNFQCRASAMLLLLIVVNRHVRPWGWGGVRWKNVNNTLVVINNSVYDNASRWTLGPKKPPILCPFGMKQPEHVTSHSPTPSAEVKFHLQSWDRTRATERPNMMATPLREE
jgi:hypothetical protein